MTTDKAQVRITLESEIDGEKQLHEHIGEWYCKNRTVYIRYEETEPHGKVRTMVRWREGELNVTRHGDVESEQSFVAGARRAGQYVSALTRFRLETDTTLLWMQCGDMLHNESEDGEPKLSLPMLLEWHYTMWLEDQLTGTFVIRLHAEAKRG
ncbi:DUF1934 domain-containing protein [Paenibacillus oenotherae]|uniref:DUF1934 domain-containing protein n=1 Tax=Paenibacillus oenotherae TaxID=1435645 RepID=A0ABS7DCV2_9BACL|nr:DUF1934 domain-containing protein [Paenibacillus oenotherae]